MEAGDETPDVHLVLYTTNQPRAKANAALLAAMYAMVCGDMTPADAYHPISEVGSAQDWASHALLTSFWCSWSWCPFEMQGMAEQTSTSPFRTFFTACTVP